MGKKYLIDQFADEAALKQQTAFVLQQLESIESKADGIAKKMSSQNIKLNTDSTGLKDMIDSMMSLQNASKSYQNVVAALHREINRFNTDKALMNQLTQNGYKVSETSAKTEREYTKVVKEFGPATKAAAKAAADAAKEKERDRKIVELATDEYFNLNKALVDAEKKYKNYFITLGAGAKETQTALKEAVSLRKILNEIDQNLGNYQRNVGNYSSAFNGLGFSIQNILRETPSLANSMNTFFMAISNNLPMLFDEIQKVNAANKAAAEAAKVAAVEARAQAEATAIAAGETKAAAVQAGLLAEQQALANSEQVKAPSLMKQISSSLFSINTLLTVSVLALTLFGSKIVDFVGGLFKSKAAIDSFKLQMEDLNKALESTDFKNAVEGVEKMRIEIDLAKQGFLNKKAVVDEYNKTLGQTLGQVNSLEEAERRLTEGGEAYIKMTLYKAAANLALEEAAKKTLEAERIRLKAEADFANSALEARINAGGIGMGGGTFNAEEEARLRKLDEDARKARKAKAIKIEEDAAKQQTDIAKKFLTDAAKLSSDFKLDFFGGKDKSKVAGETKQSLKEILDAAFEIYKIDQQRKIRLLQDDLNSDKLSYDQKIAKLQEFSTAKLELITRENENEVRVENEKLANINANLKKAKGTERENLLADKKNTEERLKIIDAKYFDEKNKVLESHNAEFDKIEQKEHERKMRVQKKNYDAFLEMLSQENEKRKLAALRYYNDSKEALDAKLALGFISEKEYKEKLLKLTIDYQMKMLESELAYAAFLLQIKKLTGQSTIDEEKKIEELRAKLHEIGLEKFRKNELSKREELLKTLKTVENVSTEVFGLIDQLLNAIETSQKNKFQEQRNAIDKNTAAQIEAVNASVATEEEKAAKIAIINARAQAQKEAIDRKEKDSEIQKARFKKTQTLFSISMTIAEALASLQFWKAAAAGIQFAIVAATPIPRFFRGKKKNEAYEGPALINDNPDGRTMEAIEHADGSFEFPSGRNIIKNIRKDDIVHADKHAFINSLIASAFRKDPTANIGPNEYAASLNQKLQADIAYSSFETNRLLKQIAGKRELSLSTSDRGMQALWKYGSNQISYINENCDW